MDLTPDAIVRVVHPTAAFFDSLQPPLITTTTKATDSILWNDSQLNPKNRIDSLDEVCNPRWRVDGSTGLGTQFYTIPLFFTKLHPLRVDTFIPEQSQHPQTLRDILDLDTAFHYKDSRIARLGISRHILRTLEYWTSNNPSLEDVYNALPFGSRIVFENLATDIRNIRVRIVPTHYLERQLMSQPALQMLWKLPASSWPSAIDISHVVLCRQIHDSVSVVQVCTPQSQKTMILKALTSYPKYLYHELRTLLSLPSHPNIISRPLYLLTKKCRFGGKVAVVGFMTEYHAAGSLRDIIPERAIHGTLRVGDQLKWALQLTSALLHIRKHGGFYPDLRLDNIVLSKQDDLVMVDFEQRGVWCEFSAPEVNYLDYISLLASESELPMPMREKYAGLLQSYLPGYKDLQADKYQNPPNGYCTPWLCLKQAEQESAEVYMLGRVLWCIFEGQSSPEVAVWQSYRHQSDLTFPHYHKTPAWMRELISKCAHGKSRKESSSPRGVIRRGNLLVLRQGDGSETGSQVQEEATRWWKQELEVGEEFLRKRAARQGRGELGDFFGRPKLEEILQILKGLVARQQDPGSL